MKKDTKKLTLEKTQNEEADETFGILIEYLIKSIPYLLATIAFLYLTFSSAELLRNYGNEMIENAATNTPDNAAITEKQNADFDVFDGLGWYFYLLFTGAYDER